MGKVTGKPRTRRGKARRLTPRSLAAMLDQRVLVDDEACRHVWELSGDLLAVMVAVSRADLPEWLKDAVLVSLCALGDPTLAAFFRRIMESKSADARDANRVRAFALARGLHEVRTTTGQTLPRPLTWMESLFQADRIARSLTPGTPAVSPEAVRASFERVRRGVADASRYCSAPEEYQDVLAAACKRLADTIEWWPAPRGRRSKRQGNQTTH